MLPPDGLLVECFLTEGMIPTDRLRLVRVIELADNVLRNKRSQRLSGVADMVKVV